MATEDLRGMDDLEITSIDDVLSGKSRLRVKVKGIPSGVVTVSNRQTIIAFYLDRKLYCEKVRGTFQQQDCLRVAAKAKDFQEHGEELVVVGRYDSTHGFLDVRYVG